MYRQVLSVIVTTFSKNVMRRLRKLSRIQSFLATCSLTSLYGPDGRCAMRPSLFPPPVTLTLTFSPQNCSAGYSRRGLPLL